MRFQIQASPAIGFHGFFCSLGYGLARIFSPLNYSPGIRKTHQHLSLPWRHLFIPPNSQKPCGPELIPCAVYDYPCPHAPQLTTHFLALATTCLTRQYCPPEMLLWEESRGHKCQDLFLCAEPSHSKGLENRQCSALPSHTWTNGVFPTSGRWRKSPVAASAACQ